MQSHRVIYLRTSYAKLTNRQAFGCVALTFDRNKSEINYQLSVANPLDEFRKDIARKVATIRLEEKARTVSFDKEVSLHHITATVMEAISNDSEAPNRARKSAKLWLRTYPLHQTGTV